MSIQPMALEDILAVKTLTLPNTAANAGWIIDSDQTLEAIRTLGIEDTIHISYNRKAFGGNHLSRSNGHYITLSQQANILRSNFTLWHEIAHAWQSEEYAIMMYGSYKQHWRFHKDAYERTGKTYEKNGFEQHANEVARANFQVNLLLKEV